MTVLAKTHFERIDVEIDDGIARTRMDGGPLGVLDLQLSEDISVLVGLADPQCAVNSGIGEQGCRVQYRRAREVRGVADKQRQFCAAQDHPINAIGEVPLNDASYIVARV